MVDAVQQDLNQREFERQIALQKVTLFERRFGENYRLLAYHAALPLVLTPELVHYLRTEFLLDLVPWEAEADLLLSDLCSQVGYELYAMDTALRAYLLEQMQQDDRIPPDRMQSIAQVLMSYVLYLSHLNPGLRERELQVQRWAAMAYLGDEQCRQMADEIAQQFEARGQQGNSTAVKAEFARLARITQELEPQLQTYPQLLEFARRVGQVLQSPDSLTQEELQKIVVVGEHRLQLPGEQGNDLVLQVLDFITAQLVEPGTEGEAKDKFPHLQTEHFTIKTVAINSPNLIYNEQQGTAQFFNESLGNDLALKMILIPAGRFMMGSPEDEPERSENEGPQHEVTVPTFFMGKYPVTQAQWKAVAAMPQINRELKPEPSRFKGDKRPVEQVSWYEAVEFCDRLSAHTGREYRLPSEAEWEYACRASPNFRSDISKADDPVGEASTPFHFGETIATDLANYNGSSEKYGAYGRGPRGIYRKETMPVDHFGIANAFGLCDMHGNVFEWCQDHWHDNYEGAPIDGSAWLSDNESAARVIRGGSWFDFPKNCRSAYRLTYDPDFRFHFIGFRVVSVAPRTL